MGEAGPSQSGWEDWVAASVAGLRRQVLFRELRPTLPGTSAVEVRIPAAELEAWAAGDPACSASAGASELRTLKLFSLNDYLGLSTHPLVRRAAADAALRCGSGPRSSALVGGYTAWHRDLETSLAALKGVEECLLFPTGFAANLAVASALCTDGNAAIFSDELNHASIVDGARLARRGGAALHVYRHNDLAQLDTLLAACPQGVRKLVITDSLFSMDGDYADLKGMAGLKSRHGFLLAVDDAHATLVCGERGAGAAEMQGVEEHVDLHIGTLSKAFGAQGGFVACSRTWKDFLVNRGRSQVYSTALPVPSVAAAQAALRVCETEPWRRRHLWALCERLGAAVGMQAQSPIVPLVLGSEQRAIGAAAALLRRGFHVPAIRPPTVPAGTSRLRISLSAGHSVEDVDALVAALSACGLDLSAGGGAGAATVSAAEDALLLGGVPALARL